MEKINMRSVKNGVEDNTLTLVDGRGFCGNYVDRNESTDKLFGGMER